MAFPPSNFTRPSLNSQLTSKTGKWRLADFVTDPPTVSSLNPTPADQVHPCGIEHCCSLQSARRQLQVRAVLAPEQTTSITPTTLSQSTALLESPPIPQEETEETVRNNCSPQGKPDHDRHSGTVTALLLPPMVSQGWE